MERVTPENIEKLKRNQIFVFGSNEAGIHGAGAAALAYKEFGAPLNVGFGPGAQCFAIPTKDWEINPLPLRVIKGYVERFIDYAKRDHSRYMEFFVTQIGCGWAGFEPADIAPFFEPCLEMKNVWLPQSFIDVLKKKEEVAVKS